MLAATEKLRKELEARFEGNTKAYAHSEGYGKIEILQERVDLLEKSVAHLMCFISEHFRLSSEQIYLESGITDF